MRLRKVAFSALLLAVSLYILLPTADEIVIHPVFGFFLSYILHLPLAYGVLISVIIYRGIGSACLFGALAIGGKPVYYKLRQKFGRKDKTKRSTVD